MSACERAGCDKPVKAKGLCSMHYDRERGPRHRHREDRVLHTRARNRAVAALIKAHQEEFAKLLAQATEQVQAENAKLKAIAKEHNAEVTGDRQVIRLKRGPKSPDEEPEDRAVFTSKPSCERCEEYHSNGHHCLHCGALPSRAIYDEAALRKLNPAAPILVPADMTDERIKAAVEAGKRRRGDEDDETAVSWREESMG